MHLCIMIYTCWTPLITISYDRTLPCDHVSRPICSSLQREKRNQALYQGSPIYYTCKQWQIQRANPAMHPLSKLAMEFGPLGRRKNNVSSANFPKCKDFGPPIDVGNGFWPPCGETLHLKT